jgi:MraZ protein
MFLGEYEHTIDSKGRVALPVRFRSGLREGIVISRGFDRCLIVYPLGEWRRMAERLLSLPITRATPRRVNRNMFSGAFQADLDRQGRVLLPASLREYAEIGSDVVIAGLYSHIEIWSKENWASEKAIMIEQAAQIAEEVD